MRRKIVAGNWKMNKNLQEGIVLAEAISEAVKDINPLCDVIIATPFIHLAMAASVIDEERVAISAENCADKASGAYTGEVSAEMIASCGARYTIIGHSERRAYYHETPEILAEKVRLAIDAGLRPIFCIGEQLSDREANREYDVVNEQVRASLFSLSSEDFQKIVLAYEPVWAIGTGRTATADQAQEMHQNIRSLVAEKYGQAVADDCSILYGGSVTGDTALELFSKPDIDGGLIGGASLTVEKFLPIIKARSSK